jgi:hypothetical protein
MDRPNPMAGGKLEAIHLRQLDHDEVAKEKAWTAKPVRMGQEV